MYSGSGLVELSYISFGKMSSLRLVTPAHYPSRDGPIPACVPIPCRARCYCSALEHDGLVVGHLKPALCGFCELQM